MNDYAPLTGMRLRQPPQNLQAEQALLGALLANNKAYDRVAEFLLPEHFADPIHGRIFAAIRRRIDAGQVADAVTLRTEFENAGIMEEVGGVGYLAQLLGAMVGIINAGEYGREIRDAWARRQLIDACEVAVNCAFGEDAEVALPQTVEQLESQLMRIGEGTQGRKPLSAAEAAQAAYDQMLAARKRGGGLTGLTWGYAGLDRMTGGMRDGDLIVIGARPSMGKTALALGIAARAAAAGAPTLFVSAEMMTPAVMSRLVAASAETPLQSLLRGAHERPEGGYEPLSDGEVDRIADRTVRIGGLPLTFDDDAHTVTAIRARARRMKGKGALRLIVIDYLGKLRGSETARRFGKVAEITELVGEIKDLAKELEVPVVLLSQLNREVEKRDDKMPSLADLRDSGAIEQDADVIGFLHREHYYLTKNPPARRDKEKAEDFEERQERWHMAVEASQGRGTLMISKQRQGPTGPVRLRFRDELTWFYDEAERDNAPAVVFPTGGR